MNNIELIKEFLNIELPNSIKESIIVLFADGDENNKTKENISYYFKDGPAECPFYKGYYYIPELSRYVINCDGEMLNVKTSVVKKWSKTKGYSNITGGYMLSHCINDFGKKVSVQRHRALCLTFKHPGIYPGKLLVNHKDGIPGNDWLDNLEFCTAAENILHAYRNNLFPNRITAIDVWNWITNERLSFTSIQLFIEHIDCSEGYVYGRLRAGNNRRYKDGWRIKRSGDEWKTLDKYIQETSNSVEVIARDIFTNEQFIFGSIQEAARHTKVIAGSINAHIDTSPSTPLYGWNFRKLDSFEGWPNYTEKHLEIFRKFPNSNRDGIEVYDCDTNVHLFFTSTNECGEYFNISQITAGKLARYEKMYKKRFKFKLFRIRQ